jgi:hypothetical protein
MIEKLKHFANVLLFAFSTCVYLIMGSTFNEHDISMCFDLDANHLKISFFAEPRTHTKFHLKLTAPAVVSPTDH